MESNHPRNVTPRNSVLKTGEATGPHPPPENDSADLACCCRLVYVQVRTDRVFRVGAHNTSDFPRKYEDLFTSVSSATPSLKT